MKQQKKNYDIKKSKKTSKVGKSTEESADNQVGKSKKFSSLTKGLVLEVMGTEEVVDEHFHKMLSGPRKTRRLPVFEEICGSS